jgi:hypothetical protein
LAAFALVLAGAVGFGLNEVEAIVPPINGHTATTAAYTYDAVAKAAGVAHRE